MVIDETFISILRRENVHERKVILIRKHIKGDNYVCGTRISFVIWLKVLVFYDTLSNFRRIELVNCQKELQ